MINLTKLFITEFIAINDKMIKQAFSKLDFSYIVYFK